MITIHTVSVIYNILKANNTGQDVADVLNSIKKELQGLFSFHFHTFIFFEVSYFDTHKVWLAQILSHIQVYPFVPGAYKFKVRDCRNKGTPKTRKHALECDDTCLKGSGAPPKKSSGRKLDLYQIAPPSLVSCTNNAVINHDLIGHF